eukprot:scaffold4743_cov171-Amphora_coffeaeformis.AAC.1
MPATSTGASRHSRNGLVVPDKAVMVGLVSLALVYSLITVVTYLRVVTSAEGVVTSVAMDAVGAKQTVRALQHTFPLHVNDGTREVIEHPGATYIRKEAFPRNLDAHQLTAPMFFDKAYGHVYGRERVRDFLGERGARLITPEEAALIGSYDSRGVETIFASVASYRDPECQGTVSDLFERAEYPERIRVAIVEQRLNQDTICTTPEKDCAIDPSQPLCKYAHLIDYFQMDAHFGVGPVFARHLAHRHYRGEYYAMQIDSHVRFTEHWDTDIVGQWKSARNESKYGGMLWLKYSLLWYRFSLFATWLDVVAILTTYPSDINGSIDPVTHESLHPARPIMCVSDFEGAGANKHLRHGQQPEGPAGIKGQPTLHPFWAAGFSFARGHFVIQVPYDQYLPMVFQGEEISIGLRAFTHGYDFYAAERGVCFHMYAIKENADRREKIPLFWENSDLYRRATIPSMKRLNTLIGMTEWPIEEWPQQEKDLYTLGKVRTTEKFFKTFGIHIKEQTVEHHLCRFVGKPMMKEFLPALRDNRMGIDYDKISYEFVDLWKDLHKGKQS